MKLYNGHIYKIHKYIYILDSPLPRWRPLACWRTALRWPSVWYSPRELWPVIDCDRRASCHIDTDRISHQHSIHPLSMRFSVDFCQPQSILAADTYGNNQIQMICSLNLGSQYHSPIGARALRCQIHAMIWIIVLIVHNFR